jgi:bacteriocin biosynthesis cyclodehydratase domain-containing protein
MQMKLKRCFSVVSHGADIVELRNGVWNPTSITLTDESKSGYLFRILSRLDGSNSPARIAKDEKVPVAEVEALIDHLIQVDAIESKSGSALDQYLDQCVPGLKGESTVAIPERPLLLIGDPALTGAIRTQLAAGLPEVQVKVLDDEDPGIHILQRNETEWLLDGLAFQEKLLQFAHWKGSTIVFVTEIINPVQCEILNRVCIELKIPWIHAAIDGPFLLVGPTFIPARSACYRCLETRVLMNMRGNSGYQTYKRAIIEGEIKRGEVPMAPILRSMLASHVALEAVNLAVTETSFTVSKILSIYLPTMEFTFHEVLKVPGCEACGSSAERDDRELYFDICAIFEERT